MTEAEAMDHALALAQEAALKGDVPVGAVVLDSSGAILGEGFNGREFLCDPVAHAEVQALRDASHRRQSWRLLDCTLVVTLEPCPMCLGAAVNARVRKVVYGARDAKGGAISLGYGMGSDQKLNHQLTLEYLPNARCSAILSEFFRARRKKG